MPNVTQICLLLSLILSLLYIFVIISIDTIIHMILVKFYTNKEMINITGKKLLLRQPAGKVLMGGGIFILILSCIFILIIIYIMTYKLHLWPYAIFFLLLSAYGILYSINSFFGEFSEYKKYSAIQKIIRYGCSCGSFNFKLYADLICAKCKKIHYKGNDPNKSLISPIINPYELLSKKKKVTDVKFSTDAPIKDLFELFAKPTPKKLWKKLRIQEIIVTSELHHIIIFKGLIKCDCTILEIDYPNRILSNLEFSNGMTISETVSFKKEDDNILVHIHSILPKKVPDLVFIRNIQKSMKTLINYLSDQLGRRFNIIFIYEKPPIYH